MYKCALRKLTRGVRLGSAGDTETHVRQAIEGGVLPTDPTCRFRAKLCTHWKKKKNAHVSIDSYYLGSFNPYLLLHANQEANCPMHAFFFFPLSITPRLCVFVKYINVIFSRIGASSGTFM
jgi:hypothetical protein